MSSNCGNVEGFVTNFVGSFLQNLANLRFHLGAVAGNDDCPRLGVRLANEPIDRGAVAFGKFQVDQHHSKSRLRLSGPSCS